MIAAFGSPKKLIHAIDSVGVGFGVPMRRTPNDHRAQAIERGLSFIYQTARKPANFKQYGFDYLGCFQGIAFTSKDPKLCRTAREMGRERARLWRRQNPKVLKDADAEDLVNLVFGSYAANSLGVRDGQMKRDLRIAIRTFTAQDYFGFDPAVEAPPLDVPEECVCGTLNERGRRTCRQCRRRLTMMSRYAVWQDALIRSYIGERYGIILGARYADAIKWLPAMRPYPQSDGGNEDYFYDAVYAVSHVIYTLNAYSRYQLSSDWLPFEYSFLKKNLSMMIKMEDPEGMGEFLDSLKSFGLAQDHPLIRKGVNYLLSSQNADGSWGELEVDDIYQRYHPTWTAIDGLRDYAWRGTRLCFPAVAPLLKGRFTKTRRHKEIDCRPAKTIFRR